MRGLRHLPHAPSTVSPFQGFGATCGGEGSWQGPSCLLSLQAGPGLSWIKSTPSSKQEPPPVPPTQPRQEHLRTRISRLTGEGSAAFNTDMPFCHELPTQSSRPGRPGVAAISRFPPLEPQGDMLPGAWCPCAPFSFSWAFYSSFWSSHRDLRGRECVGAVGVGVACSP